MKNFLFLLVFMLCGNASFSQDSSHKELVDCVLSTLRSEDDSAILRCLPNRDEHDKLMRLMFNYMLEKEQLDSIPEPDYARLYKDLGEEGIRDLARVRSLAHTHAVNWDSIRVDSTTLTKYKGQAGGMESGDIAIYITSGSQRFRIIMRECLFVSGHWRLMNRLKMEEL